MKDLDSSKSQSHGGKKDGRMKIRVKDWKTTRSRKWQLTPIFLPGNFHGQRSLKGYSQEDWKDITKCEVWTRWDRILVLKKQLWKDFPGGAVVKNLPCNTGDMSLIPGSGTGISHALQQQGPCTVPAEPVCSGARKPQAEKPPCPATKDPSWCIEDPASRSWEPMQPKITFFKKQL